MERFLDRADGGRRLASQLSPLKASRPVVLGMPRGGIPVAAEVAAELEVPLGVVLARKLGLPANPEFGIGAVAEGGARVLDEVSIERYGVTSEQLKLAVKRELATIELQAREFRGDEPPPDVTGRTVVIVDDGVATGATARAAAISVRKRGAAQIVLGVPACPPDAVPLLKHEFDDVVAVLMPSPFEAVGAWYLDFNQLSDGQVIAMLAARSE